MAALATVSALSLAVPVNHAQAAPPRPSAKAPGSAPVTVHALPPSPAPRLEAKLKQRFVKACAEAFIASAGEVRDDPEGAQGLSRQVCECAADETKSQGATDAAVAAETDAILKDRKHVIHDPHVLDALRYCAIQVMHGAEDDGS